uniref:Uncharacterized protein n=1 Tax=Rhizobium rhizogenes TaxID=359 RepID=A0A7S4ZT29_RHIRH|nr:hypothetical protein pC5.7b_376 [Rhizobium rhizogenes]
MQHDPTMPAMNMSDHGGCKGRPGTDIWAYSGAGPRSRYASVKVSP